MDCTAFKIVSVVGDLQTVLSSSFALLEIETSLKRETIFSFLFFLYWQLKTVIHMYSGLFAAHDCEKIDLQERDSVDQNDCYRKAFLCFSNSARSLLKFWLLSEHTWSLTRSTCSRTERRNYWCYDSTTKHFVRIPSCSFVVGSCPKQHPDPLAEF